MEWLGEGRGGEKTWLRSHGYYKEIGQLRELPDWHGAIG